MRELEIKLKEILDREMEVYGEMLDIARKKTEILKENKLRELELLTLDERESVESLREIDMERENVSRGLAYELGLNERLDLSAMSKYFTEEGKEEFALLRKSFNGILDELKAVNNLNNVLIKDSLEYIDFSLNLMTSATVDGNYSGNFSETDESTNKRRLFDTKA